MVSRIRGLGRLGGREARAAAILLVAALTVSGCQKAVRAAPAAPLPTVEVAEVRAAATESTIQATGLAQRQREVVLSFRVPGVLTVMNFEAGDHILSGQLVAAIDATGLAARRKQSQADLERLRGELDRNRQLYQRGFLSPKMMEGQQAAFTLAEAADEASRFDEGAARIASPVTGNVLQRLAQAGEVIQPGQPVLKVADAASPLVLRAPLSVRDAAKVRVGDAATAYSNTSSKGFVGRIARIADAADPVTGTVTVEIELEAQAALRSGEAVRAELVAHGDQSAVEGLRLPAEALIEGSGDRASVFVLDGNSRARRTPVQFLRLDGEDALVRGLPPGTEVITAGGGFIHDGDRVRVNRSLLARADHAR